jgi:tetratricopeptide (TPR) repeat protein
MNTQSLLRRCALYHLLLALSLLGTTACRHNDTDPQRRAAEAKALFERTTKEFHLPSAVATGAEKRRLETEAVRGYQQVLEQYPEQEYWCAEALRSLGNVRAAQTNLNAALKCWSKVAADYPRQDWEVLLALKSSADLLWDANRRDEAKVFYQEVVSRFDRTNTAAVVRTIVRGSKYKLQGKSEA